ncbi:histidine kinase [Nocardioidaceae bacterium]|nr:histidine kinase [Nocardioidaceae bacterium]
MRRLGISRRPLGSDADRATFRALHLASLAGPPLREGLDAESASLSLTHLHRLLGSPVTALTGTEELLAWEGRYGHHRADAPEIARRALASGRTEVVERGRLACDRPGCEVRHAVAAPLVVEGRGVGTLQVYAPRASGALLRATEEVAAWVSGQLELAELDESRTRLVEAELRALRAQISPHFVYNSLSAIASFVRTDPDRARELLLEFADFTRYSFRRHGEFTTLAEELRSVERYLVLEQARFGERLRVQLQVAPEVLGVTIPFLCLQPLVENAVRHGLEGQPDGGRVTLTARDDGAEAVVSVEDDGAGEDPDRIRRILAGEDAGDSVGLGNVDARLRSVFGEEHGLVVETARGAGTKVTVRFPKFAVGVSA